jgi:ferritin-like metal-binding protein YciE
VKDCREWLVQWLNDAYVMEEGIINALENHVEQAKDHPEIQVRIRAHVDHTKSQAERVKECVKMLGGKVSSTKEPGGEMMASLASTGVGAEEDRVIKNMLTEYATEHFEMASYLALAQAAADCGQQEVATLCREIVQEEVQMVETLSRNLEGVVSDFLRPYRTRARAA